MRLRKAIQRFTRRFGYEIRRLPPNESGIFIALNQIGFDLVLDIGANCGQFASELRKAGYQGEIASFEPSSAAFTSLQAASASDPSWRVYREAIGASAGTSILRVASNNAASSSFFDFTRNHLLGAPEVHWVDKQEVDVVTLSEVLGRVHHSGSIFAKFDVQGSEYDILASIDPKELRAVVAMAVEISLVEVYAGAPYGCEVLQLIEDAGYRLFKVFPEFTSRESGELLQANYLFVRKDLDVA